LKFLATKCVQPAYSAFVEHFTYFYFNIFVHQQTLFFVIAPIDLLARLLITSELNLVLTSMKAS